MPIIIDFKFLLSHEFNCHSESSVGLPSGFSQHPFENNSLTHSWILHHLAEAEEAETQDQPPPPPVPEDAGLVAAVMQLYRD